MRRTTVSSSAINTKGLSMAAINGPISLHAAWSNTDMPCNALSLRRSDTTDRSIINRYLSLICNLIDVNSHAIVDVPRSAEDVTPSQKTTTVAQYINYKKWSLIWQILLWYYPIWRLRIAWRNGKRYVKRSWYRSECKAFPLRFVCYMHHVQVFYINSNRHCISNYFYS